MIFMVKKSFKKKGSKKKLKKIESSRFPAADSFVQNPCVDVAFSPILHGKTCR
jgi:hypothetical protein